MIALLGASKTELRAAMKFITVERRISGHTWPMVEGKFSGKDILLVQTGIGRACAQEAAEYILEQYPVSNIISFGFSGALVSELEVGALVLCQKLFCSAHAGESRFRTSDPGLIAKVKRLINGTSIGLFIASSLTVDHLVSQSEEKMALGKAFCAQVVDMESYWIASSAARRNIPFLSVRAISDTLGERLPPFDRFINPKGVWLWKESLRHFLIRPGDLIAIARIYFHAQKARRSLTLFLQLFISQFDEQASL